MRILKKGFLLGAGLFVFISTFSQADNDNEKSPEENNLSYIDPTIGNVAQLLQPTRPTVQLPNQMMRMYPQRKDFIDDQISCFPLIIVSHRLGEAFSLKPSIQPVSTDSWKQRMDYDQDLEITRPWYYSTYLIDDDLTVEYTPGKKTGIYRFTFPENAPQKSILFNTFNPGETAFSFISADELTGQETYHNDIKIYLYGKFSSKGSTGTVNNGALTDAKTIKGPASKAWISFPGNNNRSIEFRYAISYISPEQARWNFDSELAGAGFESMKAAGEQAWAKVIGQIKTEGGTEAQKRSFYSALYRSYERMVDITENGRYYSGFDKKIHTTTRPFYVDDWTWDTYLAHHPLRTILNPAMEEDMLNSYVTMFTQGGWLPTFPVLFGDHACMNGFHSSILFLDAYRKGLRNYNAGTAFQGMLRNGNEATMLPWRNGPKTELDDFYYARGYFPALQKDEAEPNKTVDPFEKRQAVAVTLGASYDDWAVGQMAKELGDNDDYKKFTARSVNYKNLWNDKAKMFYPKDSKGNWVNIDPKIDGGLGGRDYYDENNGWTYLWQVQHDIEGLINLLGGRDLFEKKLDQLFREDLGSSKYAFNAKFPDATGLVGQYSMGNEPSFHIPYLYNYTGAPWKTQKHIRLLLNLWFRDNVFGIPGDEDGGGMTSFVVFSSMGFYPLTPGRPVYTIGSPIFKKITIDLSNGKKFTILAKGCSVKNKYIQSAKFNNLPINTPWFTHEQLIAGGTLELEMGSKPNKTWGTGERGF